MPTFHVGEISPKLFQRLQIFFAHHSGEITLSIDSSGGPLSVALSIHELIREEACKRTVVGLVTSKADSSALLVLQACTKRIAKPAATFLFHPARSSKIHFDGTSSLFEVLVATIKEWWKTRGFQKQATQIFVNATTMSEGDLINLMNRKHRINTHGALHFGFIDAVLPPQTTM